MIRFARPLLVACAVLALAACEKQAEPAKPAAPAAPATAPAAAPATTTPPPAAPATATPAAAPVTADSIGVPECDNYITKYVACVSAKVPEASRAQLQASLDQMRTAWKQAAATDAGKASLAQACTAANDAAKQSMTAFGCTDF